MGLADRITALEERVERLESRTAAVPVPAAEGAFWALEGLKARAPGGGLLFTGAVDLPTGEHYEWQHGQPAEALLEADWEALASDLAPQLTALAHPVRLALIGQVLAGTQSVSELQLNPGLGTSGQVYHHLRQLVAAGWLRAVGGGRYEVPVARIVPLLTTLLGAR